MGTSRVPADVDLPAFAEQHLLYELEMLTRVAYRLHDHPPIRPDPIVESALIESFAVHARNLLSFFYDEPRKEDDAVAGDFVSGWQAPGLPADLRDLAVQVNKQIAHLTYTRARLTEQQQRWYVAKIGRALAEIMDEFVDQAPAELLSQKFTSGAHECIHMLRIESKQQRPDAGVATSGAF